MRGLSGYGTDTGKAAAADDGPHPGYFDSLRMLLSPLIERALENWMPPNVAGTLQQVVGPRRDLRTMWY